MAPNELNQFTCDLEDASERLRLLRENLPVQVSIAALGVAEKLPWKILTLRESLLWRIEELGRVGLESVKSNNAIAAVVLARALLETVALLWEVHRLFDASRDVRGDEMTTLVDRMLLGSYQDDALPKPIRVGKFIDALNVKFPGVRRKYDEMSELAHPNFRGVHGSHARIDKERFMTFYGRDNQAFQSSLRDTANIMVACLATAEISYNEIADLFPDFLKRFTPL